MLNEARHNINTFTLYRPTTAFMDTLNSNPENLHLHRMRSMFSIGENFCREATEAINTMLDKGQLIPAATVICSLENLYRLTNTISQLWTENKEVSIVNPDAAMSSTTIGDVFTDENDHFYVVTVDGFTRLMRPN